MSGTERNVSNSTAITMAQGSIEEVEQCDKQYPSWLLKVAPRTSMLYRLFLGPDPLKVRRKICIMTAIVIAFNVSVWVAAAIIFRSYPGLIGIAALAYTLGLRHAVDAGKRKKNWFLRYLKNLSSSTKSDLSIACKLRSHLCHR
jgi:hypothetical protein